jgi:hypothetical protein
MLGPTFNRTSDRLSLMQLLAQFVLALAMCWSRTTCGFTQQHLKKMPALLLDQYAVMAFEPCHYAWEITGKSA